MSTFPGEPNLNRGRSVPGDAGGLQIDAPRTAARRAPGHLRRSFPMPYEYKRRRPSIIRNFWVYRRLIGTAFLLGMILVHLGQPRAGDGPRFRSAWES